MIFFLSCQNHPFPPKYFVDGVVYHSGEDRSPWVFYLLKIYTYGRMSGTFGPTMTWCSSSNKIVPGIFIEDGTV